MLVADGSGNSTAVSPLSSRHLLAESAPSGARATSRIPGMLDADVAPDPGGDAGPPASVVARGAGVATATILSIGVAFIAGDVDVGAQPSASHDPSSAAAAGWEFRGRGRLTARAPIITSKSRRH